MQRNQMDTNSRIIPVSSSDRLQPADEPSGGVKRKGEEMQTGRVKRQKLTPEIEQQNEIEQTAKIEKITKELLEDYNNTVKETINDLFKQKSDPELIKIRIISLLNFQHQQLLESMEKSIPIESGVFERLPNEAKLQILSSMENVSLKSLLLVNKLFKELTEDVLIKKDFTINYNNEEKAKSLDLNYLESVITNYSDKIETLTINNKNFQIFKRALSSTSIKFPKLEHLYLNRLNKPSNAATDEFIEMQQIVLHCPNLKVLFLSHVKRYCHELAFDSEEDEEEAMEQLKANVEPIVILAEKCKHLSTLNLLDETYIINLDEFLEKCSGIESIRLSSAYKSPIHFESKNSLNLKHLDLQDTGLDDEDLTLFAKKCPNLESVILSKWCTARGLKNIATHCLNLKYLDISHMLEIDTSEAELESIAKQFKNLESLKVSSYQLQKMIVFAKNCPNLSCIDIGQALLSKTMEKEFKTRYPKIKILSEKG